MSRTLALVSKILQRLSNCVVSAQPLTIKEQWMADIFERFTDEKHRLAMVKFLDRISCVGGENSISGDSVSVLKEGCVLLFLLPLSILFPLVVEVLVGTCVK